MGEVRKLMRLAAVSVDEGEPLPEAFLLFAPGDNESSKGSALFDAAAAESVMSVYSRQGVDLMIDVDHASLDQAAAIARRDAGDAVGWFALELREGALWAVNVRWNPEGERQLRNKLRRYISPAFYLDDSGRVSEVINVALVAMPATYNAQPLIAASRGRKCWSQLDPKQVQEAVDALIAQDAEKALEILNALLVAAAGGEPEEEPETDPSAEAPEPPPPEEMPLASKLSALLGVEGDGAIEAAVAELCSASSARDAERLAQENSARKAFVGALVKLGAELPSTAWEGDPSDQVPVARLASEPIDSLRARVAALRGRSNSPAQPPAGKPAVARYEKYIKNMTEAQKARFLAIKGVK